MPLRHRGRRRLSFTLVVALGAAVALVLIPGALSTPTAPIFATHVDYSTGSAGAVPLSVAVGDLSGDGKPDLAFANQAADTAPILIGQGSGTFNAATPYATGDGPSQVVIGDVNKDTKNDLVTANFGANTISVLLGNGDGTVQAKSDFTVGDQPFSLALADLNADGNLDVVTANGNGNSVSVLLGTGTGSLFAAKVDYPTAARALFVAVGDLNGDTKPDLAVANTNSKISVLPGNGNGTFGTKTDFTTATGPQAVAIGDLNGDGKNDLVTANFDPGNKGVSVLLGDGAGAFPAHTDYDLNGGQTALGVAAGDVNSDGFLDVVAASDSEASAFLLLGNGDGTLGTAQALTTGGELSSVAVADLNGDALLDIVGTAFVADVGSVLLQITPPRTLTVSKSGTGSGTVTSFPGGINCGSTCSSAYDQGVSVMLSAGAASGSTFTGWSGGGCSGTGICTVTMDADKTVTATFTAQRTLTVSKSGSGSGTVTSSPAGIDCGSTCSHDYDQGTSVTLTASGANGSSFDGFSGGGCSGTGDCTVTMSADTTVTTTFTATSPPHTTLTKSKIDKNNGSATFRFTGSGGSGSLSFRCKLDAGSFKSCDSPKKYKHLKDGKHKFKVEAVDAEGKVDPTPASKTFTIDHPPTSAVGRVASPHSACLSGRTVALSRKKAGQDNFTRIGSDVTNRAGDYRVNTSAVAGATYRASVEQRKLNKNDVCKAATSQTVKYKAGARDTRIDPRVAGAAPQAQANFNNTVSLALK